MRKTDINRIEELLSNVSYDGQDDETIVIKSNNLDELVEILNLDRRICPNFSRLVDGGISDTMADSHGQGMIRNYVHSSLGLSYRETREWDYKQFIEVFERNACYTIDPGTFITESAMKTLFPSSQITDIMLYRWKNNMLFKDYRERICYAIDTLAKSEESKILKSIESYQKMLKVKAALEEDFDALEKMAFGSMAFKSFIRRAKPDSITMMRIANSMEDSDS